MRKMVLLLPTLIILLCEQGHAQKKDTQSKKKVSVAIVIDPGTGGGGGGGSSCGAVGGTVSITSESASRCAGTNSTTLTVTGYVGTIQWLSSTDNYIFDVIDGATGASYTATNLSVTTYFVARAHTSTCDKYSNSLAVTITAGTVWYKDADNDRYSDGTTITQCDRPDGYKLVSELTATSGDCNDNNRDINPETVWYKDSDKDKYSDGTTVISCTKPLIPVDPTKNFDPVTNPLDNYVLRTQLIGPALEFDCDDNNPNVYPGKVGSDCYHCPSGTIIYVKKDATGSNDGSSWANAFTSLQTALYQACPNITQIWVASGTYYPDEGGGKTNNDRNAAFVMKKDLAIYGGFSGTETSLNQRNWKLNETILSGDIDQNDLSSNFDGNSYHVVVNNKNSLTHTAILDGFTIRGGNANYAGNDISILKIGGGGLLNISSSPAILNCTIKENQTVYTGGGVYNQEATPTFTGCLFAQNSATLNGGAVYNTNEGILSEISFQHCNFQENSAASGTAMYNESADVSVGYSGFVRNTNGVGSIANECPSRTKIVNSIFSRNNVAVLNFRTTCSVSSSANLLIVNCSFSQNVKSVDNNGELEFYNSISDLTIVDYTQPTENPYAPAHTFAIRYSNGPGFPSGNNNLSINPLFTDPANDNLRLQSTSPVINQGSAQLYDQYSDGNVDLDGNPRKTGEIDMGAYEYTACTTADWVLDADNDNYYTGQVVSSCVSPGDGYKLKTNQLPGDCDDNNGAINPATIWVIDADGDGYYSDITITGCTAPSSYQIKTNQQMGDCNDSDAAINPSTVWYVDRDQDGYTSGDYVMGCERPKIRDRNDPTIFTWGKLASELNSMAIDCNDEFYLTGPASVWYKDADNDGYSDGTTITDCFQPTGYKLASALTATIGDCDDNDASVNAATVWYRDADGDGYAVSITSCTSPGEGYTKTVLPIGDCDDTDPAINPETVWYEDRDNDGYPSGRTAIGCERPKFWYDLFSFTSGKLASELMSTTLDCDDANASLFPMVWYKDADNDGYSDGTTQTACGRPSGYKKASELNALNGDCNDADGAINPVTRWYPDLDNDGYSTGSYVVQCQRPNGYKLATALTATTGDCDDNNAAVNPQTRWYTDADGDRYGTGTFVTQCARPANGFLATELTAIAGDCDDNNAAVNPGIALDVTPANNITTTTSADGKGNCSTSVVVPNASFTNNCASPQVSWTMTGATIGSGSGQVGERTFNKGITTIEYTVTDNQNRTAKRSMTVTVNDDELPTITAPGAVNSLMSDDGTGNCITTAVLGAPQVADNCTGTLTVKAYVNYGAMTQTEVTPPNATSRTTYAFSKGITVVTWEVTDASNNKQTATQNVTVVDDERPTITAPVAKSIAETDAGKCDASGVILGTPTFADNCAGPLTVKAYVNYGAPTQTEITPKNTSNIVDFSKATAYAFPFGTTAVTWEVTDASNNKQTATQNIVVQKVNTVTTVKVEAVSPTVAQIAGQAPVQQYSDKVTYTATVTPFNCGSAGQIGGTVTFKIGNLTMGTSPVDPLTGKATFTAPLLEDAVYYTSNMSPSYLNPTKGPLVPGAKTVTAVYNATDPDYAVANPTTSLTVANEDADVDYTGGSFFTVNPSTLKGTIYLSASVADRNDASDTRGDVRNATVTFRDGGYSGTVVGEADEIPVGLIDPANKKKGIANTSFNDQLNSSDVNSGGKIYNIWAGATNYYTGSMDGDYTPVTLGMPGQDFVTGGGYIILGSNVSGKYGVGAAGMRMHGGLVMKWNKSGKNVQGQVNIIFRRMENGVKKIYQIKSNAINTLVVNDVNDAGTVVSSNNTFRRATITTKCNLTDITNPLAPVSLGGNLTLLVTAWESTTVNSGALDRISVELTGSGSIGVLFSSNWSGGKTTWQTLNGGKMQVRSASNQSGNTKLASTSVVKVETKPTASVSKLTVAAYPNPAVTYFTIKLTSSNTTEKISLRVYNQLGQLMDVKNNLYSGQMVQVGSNFKQGTYFVEAVQGDQRERLQLVKTN